jgi:hypothetical protein
MTHTLWTRYQKFRPEYALTIIQKHDDENWRHILPMSARAVARKKSDDLFLHGSHERSAVSLHMKALPSK